MTSFILKDKVVGKLCTEKDETNDFEMIAENMSFQNIFFARAIKMTPVHYFDNKTYRAVSNKDIAGGGVIWVTGAF